MKPGALKVEQQTSYQAGVISQRIKHPPCRLRIKESVGQVRSLEGYLGLIYAAGPLDRHQGFLALPEQYECLRARHKGCGKFDLR
jgi:hypothetical protein